MAKKRFTLRIEEDLFQKLYVLSKYEVRSINNEIRIIIRNAINEFESINGEISYKNNNK